MTITRFDAICSLVGGELAGDDEGKNVNYFSGQKAPTEKAITDEIARLEVSTKWENVRSERNRKLAETDYLALSDNTLRLSNDMKSYRQHLRDVPTQSDPDKIDWGTKP